MKVICCYCGKDLGDKAPFEDKSISHGAHKSCAEKDLKRQLALIDHLKARRTNKPDFPGITAI